MLDDLNRALRPHGLWFPVDVSTASRATIGGMTANNSCGGRSLRYGNTRENVIAIDALLADGAKAHFGPMAADLSDLPAKSPLRPLASRPVRAGRARGRRDRGALSEGAAPRRRLQHRRAGAGQERHQPRAHPGRLRGHAGVLDRDRTEAVAAARAARAVGACHFGSFHEAMAAAQHIVKLAPDRRRTGRRHHDRAGARDRRCSARRWTRSCAAGRRRCCWSSSPRTPGRECAPPARA